MSVFLLKVKILGTVKELALLAETMTAKFQTSLSREFRLLHLSSHSLPCRSGAAPGLG